MAKRMRSKLGASVDRDWGQRHHRLLAVVFCVLLALTMSGCRAAHETKDGEDPQRKTLTVRYLDVGQGDSCFITLPSGETMVIDAGTRSAGGTLVKTLADAGVTRVDYLILTHPHEDHIGGAGAVIKAFDIGEVVMPRSSHTTVTYENLLRAIKDKGLMVTEAKAGKVLIDSSDLKASLVGPAKSYSDLNDLSAVVVLTYDSQVFLFAGDAGSAAEKDMIAAKTIPEVDVLKVGHHGSATSTSSSFLRAMSPSIAVISVGADNDYGHPTKSLLDRLAAAQVSIYRTDLHGTITVSSDGESATVSTEKSHVVQGS